MKNIIIASVLSFLMLGCVSIPDQAPKVTVVQPKNVLIQSISVKEIDGQWIVSGKVKLRTRTAIKPLPGSHIDYMINTQNGELVDEGAVKLSRRVKYRQNPSRYSKFSIQLPKNISSSSQISIGFHPVKPKFDELEISHKKNILI